MPSLSAKKRRRLTLVQLRQNDWTNRASSLRLQRLMGILTGCTGGWACSRRRCARRAWLATWRAMANSKPACP